MPWSPTQAFPHPLANIQPSNLDKNLKNLLSYPMVEMITWQGLGKAINKFRTRILHLEPVQTIWGLSVVHRLQIPVTYCWYVDTEPNLQWMSNSLPRSPFLIPRPKDWANHLSVAGFYFLESDPFTPDQALLDFIHAGPPPIYIGFGSIVVDNPQSLTDLVFEAIRLTGQRALVSIGWSGLGSGPIPENVFLLGNVPHDWLFPKVSCVVHHGGAGTTATGIQAGKPTVIVPFFGDQMFWGSMIARAGAGPRPIPYKHLTATNLAAAIQSALDPGVESNAVELGVLIARERGCETGATTFHQQLGMDDLRCHVDNSRTAVWLLRRSSLRLSSFAAAVLVNAGLLKYKDLKPCVTLNSREVDIG
jgi:UDP:flavonoid glycosyltransferase YjiC (YdhE family)